jgi:integrase
MAEHITDLTLRKLSAPENKRLELWDARIPGFGVRVSPSGSKSFVLVYRHRGRPRRLTLGKYPIVSLAEARERALNALSEARRGLDPQQDKQADRKALRFDETVQNFVESYCHQNNRESTWRETERILRIRFTQNWGARDIREIKRADVLFILDKAIRQKTPSAAIHALVAVRVFFNWCKARGLVEVNPCDGIKRPAKVVSRDRFLNDLEIGVLWNASTALGYPFGTICQLLLLTGQRRGEVTKMRWSDIDLEGRCWLIPKHIAKNGNANAVPLVANAYAILSRLPRTDPVWVFPARGGNETAFSGFSKCKSRLDELMGNICTKQTFEEIPSWTLHDLRRTISTHLASMGVAPHIIERLLNHISGVLGGVAGVYNRFKYRDEVRAALEQWAVHVETCANAISNPGERSGTSEHLPSPRFAEIH